MTHLTNKNQFAILGEDFGSLPESVGAEQGLPHGSLAPADQPLKHEDSKMNSPINGGRGYVKMFRSILDIPKADDPEHFALWTRLILLATHTQIRRDFAGKTIILEPGQFTTSHVSLSKQSGIDESKVRRILKRLKSDEMIDEQTSTKGSLITITNWVKWQTPDEQVDEQLTNDCQMTDEQLTSNRRATDDTQESKNHKNEKNLKKERMEESTFPTLSEDEATFISDLVKSLKTRFRGSTVTVENQTKAYMTLRKRMHSFETIKNVMRWVWLDTEEAVGGGFCSITRPW